MNDRGTVIFEVWLDGAMKYRSPVVKGYEKAVPISIPVAGGNELKLIVTDGGDGSGYDHADWAGARLVNQPTTTPPPPTPTPVSPPATPTGLMTTPGNATVAAKWNAVTGAASYKLFRSSVSGQQGIQIGGTLLGTTFNDTGLTNGTTYLYSVPCHQQRRFESALRASQRETGGSSETPARPSKLECHRRQCQSHVDVGPSLKAPPLTTSYRSTTSGGQTTPMQMAIAGTTFTDTTVTNGTNYYYKVAGVNAVGTGAMSPQASAKPVAPPPPPATHRPVRGPGRLPRSLSPGPPPPTRHPITCIARPPPAGREPRLSRPASPAPPTRTPVSRTMPPSTTRSPP
ncbi:MAG: NPCBM/NEW2 domain-containing protein [Acidobacteriota bacterium]